MLQRFKGGWPLGSRLPRHSYADVWPSCRDRDRRACGRARGVGRQASAGRRHPRPIGAIAELEVGEAERLHVLTDDRGVRWQLEAGIDVHRAVGARGSRQHLLDQQTREDYVHKVHQNARRQFWVKTT